MKKVLKGILIVILILSVIVGALMAWQWKNIKMVMTSISNTEEDIDVLVTNTEEKIDEILNSLTGSTFRALTEEEREKLLSGELTEEEAKEIIKVEEVAETESNVDDILARIYLLRAEYVNRITELEKEAKSVGKKAIKGKIPITEKLKLIDEYLAKGNALEKECDAKMDALIAELEAELKRLGEDTKIISEVRSVYNSEKELKKSQLLSKYKKYLK